MHVDDRLDLRSKTQFPMSSRLPQIGKEKSKLEVTHSPTTSKRGGDKEVSMDHTPPKNSAGDVHSQTYDAERMKDLK